MYIDESSEVYVPMNIAFPKKSKSVLLSSPMAAHFRFYNVA